jgi:hypothetical protein
MVCSVCQGRRVLRLTPAEALDWSDRPESTVVSFVVQKCWACNGTGRLTIEERQRHIEHFGH